VAAIEYSCRLIRNRPGKWHTPAARETLGEHFPFRLDLTSTPSKMNALVFAMDRFGGKRQGNVEEYSLEVRDAEDVLLATLNATDRDLQEFDAGYPISVANEVPSSLASYSDADLLSELHRRLSEARD
jgi:hypothetical protein